MDMTVWNLTSSSTYSIEEEAVLLRAVRGALCEQGNEFAYKDAIYAIDKCLMSHQSIYRISKAERLLLDLIFTCDNERFRRDLVMFLPRIRILQGYRYYISDVETAEHVRVRADNIRHFIMNEAEINRFKNRYQNAVGYVVNADVGFNGNMFMPVDPGVN